MIARLMERYLRDVRARTILDVGPGYGAFGRVAARVTEATDVTFLDCDQDILDWQTNEYRKANLRAVGVRGFISVDALSKLDGPFDLVLCQELLEHLSNAEEILQALVGQLESDGRMIITVPTRVSERWLKWLNPSYMRDEPHGHVREYDEKELVSIIDEAGLSIVAIVPTQPHFFLGHTWLYGTRMQVEGSTGKVLTKGIRGAVFDRLTSYSKRFFGLTGPESWGRLLPRNYFVVATRKREEP